MAASHEDGRTRSCQCHEHGMGAPDDFADGRAGSLAGVWPQLSTSMRREDYR
jgi:hypothetical protein